MTMKKNDMKFTDCVKLLMEHEAILLITHKNPDGDTLGSAAALCSALRRKGKHAYLYANPQVSGLMRPYVEEFFAPEGSEEMFDYYVAVDVADEKLFPKGFSLPVDLCIDHHEVNTHYAANELIRSDRSSCGEIILELIKVLHKTPTAQEATLLYIAVSTDTGCFQYLNTNSKTLAAAAELVRYGADNGKVSTDFFRKVSAARLRLEGAIYSSLSFHKDDKIVVAVITQKMLYEVGANEEEDLGDLAGLAGRLRGGAVSVTIREQKNGESRVSVRSDPTVSSSEICGVFGGGGHAMAAGCTIPAPPEKAKAMLLAVIVEIMQ